MLLLVTEQTGGNKMIWSCISYMIDDDWLQKTMNISPGVRNEKLQCGTGKSDCTGGRLDGSCKANDMTINAGDESDALFDLDDVEIGGYLLNKEEKCYKKIIWEQINREYLEEQAAKEAAAAAAREAFSANFKGSSEELTAQELAAATKAAVANAKKEKQQKRSAKAKNSNSRTDAEANRCMLEKRLSSKINYEALEKLFAQTEAPEITKKRKTEQNNSDGDMPRRGGRELETQKMHRRDDEPEQEEENDETEGDAEGEESGYDQYYEDANEAAYDYDGNDYGYGDF